MDDPLAGAAVKRALAAVCLLAACAPSYETNPGYDAPIRVASAQYFDTPLPGAAPDAAMDSPLVTAIVTDTQLVYSGASGLSIQGRVEDGAVAIGLGMPALSNVHWVFPASGSTPEFPGELTWSARVSFDRSVPSGMQAIRAVGIDAQGHAGRQYEQMLCVLPTYPDNLHACDPTRTPPDLVVTLDWDADADVDLELITPEGRRIDPKHPLVIPPMMGMIDDTSPRLDRDSLRGCVPDGWRQESIAFDTVPDGEWEIDARLFQSCGISSVRFRLRVLRAQGEMPNRELVTTLEQGGEFIAQYDEDQGARGGLRLAILDLP